ncbi:GNAT family N-acetyltransferase [Paracoccus aurantiacus]|uniref:GNAT family N-acetyltransferase n=1 Tax=Paracoccus aurantiacus TaxID=2599412 RepID=A0A5C6S485_9RHOB|nr:GNAT family N-acetyltransferase [Paracoccus aurantiacus]TXB68641.1 GNAT family N-acetyltransferase [Paracoccus aurantiacus]
MDVRAVTADDRDQWQGLWDGYQRFYGHPDRPQDFFDTAFARLTSGEANDFQGFVADDGGRLIGLTHYVFHPNLWRPGGVCYLQDLFTLPEARGKGIGRALIEAVSTAAKARGAQSLYWLTAEDNYAGRMLYDRLATRTPFIKYQRDF